jgi:hypothetical protein
MSELTNVMAAFQPIGSINRWPRIGIGLGSVSQIAPESSLTDNLWRSSISLVCVRELDCIPHMISNHRKN